MVSMCVAWLACANARGSHLHTARRSVCDRDQDGIKRSRPLLETISDQGLFLEAINDQDVLRATVHQRFSVIVYLSLMPRSRAKVWAQDIIDPRLPYHNSLRFAKLRIRRVSRECKRSSVTDATHARERMSEVGVLATSVLSL